MFDFNHSSPACRRAVGAGPAGPLSNREFERIAEWLGSDDLIPLLQAQQALDEIGPKRSEPLLRLLRDDLGAYRRSKRRVWQMLLLAGLLFGVALGGHVLRPDVDLVPAALLLSFPGWLAALFLIAWYRRHQLTRRRMRNVVRLLEIYQPVAATGALLEAYVFGEKQASTIAAATLMEMLPRLKPADAALLEERHTACLRRLLRGHDSRLILLALYAIEQGCNRRSLPDVQRLATCPVWIAYSSRIRTAATACLAELQRDTEACPSPMPGGGECHRPHGPDERGQG